MNKWIVIVIVCAVGGFIIEPVGRVIRRKLTPKWLAFAAEFIAGCLIFAALYTIAALLGFSIWR